jgi:macrolide transport system ATP-binding/permease protein
MIPTFIKFHNVTFYHDAATKALLEDITLHIGAGWTGVVGANGSGKTTLLKLATGLFKPSKGLVDAPRRVVYCSQRTDNAPENLAELIASPDKEAMILKGQLGINPDWVTRWPTLSHGERKRAQIGHALWVMPNVLAIDEPTNHVDAKARKILITALHSYPGTGLLVSHDRELLDSLCRQCIFIDPPAVVIRKGGYTKGKRSAAEEGKSLQKQRSVQRKAYKKLRREAGKRREKANNADTLRSKRGIAKKDHDAKGKIDAARLSGKDGVGGKLLRQLDGRLSRVQTELETLKVKKDHALGIWLPGALSRRNTLLELAQGSLSLGNQKQLDYPKLYVKPDDRIGITGENGSGKSTLIQKIVSIVNAPKEHITYVPQEIEIEQARHILLQARALPHEQKGHLMTIVSRLGSRPGRLLESRTPSPGETRKLLLAMGMTQKPHIIIMDEPTNHMDLPSIECLEQALFNCPCCLVLISHDQRFLDKLTHRSWHISREKEDLFSLAVHY